MHSSRLTRRQMLRAGVVASGATLVAACTPNVVKETVEVKQTVVVKEEVEVTSVVEKQVTTVVEKEVVVTATPGPGECEMDWTPTFPEPFKKYDPPVEVNIVLGERYDSLPENGPYNKYNNPMYNRILEHTDVRYMSKWEPAGDPAADSQKLNTAIASGDPPDMWQASGTFLQELIDFGALAEFKEIWEATASPLVKEKKGYPDHYAWKQVLQDGKLYGIPMQSGPADNDDIGFIRQDWLDKVGMKMPETIDDITEVARAWKKAGICEYGIAASKQLVTWMVDLAPVLGAYGHMPGAWVEDGAGGLTYDSLSDGVKQALAQIRSWYAEGLMDPDFITYDPYPGGYQSVSSEKCGIWFSPFWNYNIDLNVNEKIPEFLQVIMPYPKGPEGKQGRWATMSWGAPVIFRAGLDPVVIEALINNLNWQTEFHANWEKYQQYGAFDHDTAFLEGWDWAFDENCEVVIGPYPGTWHCVEFGWNNNPGYPSQQYDIYAPAFKWMNEPDKTKLNKAQRYLVSSKANQRSVEGFNYSYETQAVQIVNQFWGTPGPKMTERLPDLKTLEDTVFLNIIVGNDPIERFDEFVQEWKANGGDDITAEVSAWYRSINS